ncbi:hypothetical protein GJ744_012014 [Endocarpon pusillum]|uniref:Uncharacterized protein n=1 Tax=Endocarpon pusillum TaxID=364733 RepID=A0A8H7ATK0_9EURO|nr:hypothetical protein GJ744_012014 [Endocarpon pusillum]
MKKPRGPRPLQNGELRSAMNPIKLIEVSFRFPELRKNDNYATPEQHGLSCLTSCHKSSKQARRRRFYLSNGAAS